MIQVKNKEVGIHQNTG